MPEILSRKNILKGIKLGLITVLGANTADTRRVMAQEDKRLHSQKGIEEELLRQKDINAQLFKAINVTRRETGLRPFTDLFTLEEKGEHEN